MFRSFAFIGVCLVLVFVQRTSAQTVDTSLGTIRGSILTSLKGSEIYAFRGIRYAQAPIGALRFSAPVPVEPWNETVDATADALICPQPGVQSLMSEDCLVVNVYSRNLTGSVPVIVYIHGGANILGSGHSLYEAGPQYLLDHEIVLVSFNYRLGALGFLSTGTAEAPGNYGYLDQVLALQWVQDHIANFGGDPNLVTIFGLSAGSMAVTLHMASPLSKGLFHRAIAMSGSATNHYSIDNLAWTRKLAREVSCPMYNPQDVVECLRDVSWNSIVDVCSEWEPYDFINMKWNYEIDGHFLTDHPSELFLVGDFYNVPLIAGITKNELDFSAYHQENNTNLLNDISVSFDSYAPELFLYNGTADESDPRKSASIQSFYLEDTTDITKDNLQQFGEMFSDAIIGHGVHRLVALASRYIDVFYYRMDYVGASSIYMDDEGKPRGVGHADDIQYVMPGLWYAPNFDPDSTFMIERITKWWTTFAKYGVPMLEGEGEWQPSNSSAIVTLYNNNETQMGAEPYPERYALWDTMFPLSASDATSLKLSGLVGLFLVTMRYFM